MNQSYIKKLGVDIWTDVLSRNQEKIPFSKKDQEEVVGIFTNLVNEYMDQSLSLYGDNPDDSIDFE